MTAGTDENGFWLTNLLLDNRVLAECGTSRARYNVATGVKNVSKARLGAVDVLMTMRLTVKMATPKAALAGGGGIVAGATPGAWKHTAACWRFLGDNAEATV